MKNQKKKKVNIKDIAKMAGVSYQVVSSILNKRQSTIRFSKETERKVTEIAKDVNYRPDFFGRSLKQNKSFLVGVLGFEVNSPLFAGILMGMQEIMIPRDHAPLLLIHNSAKSENDNFLTAMDRKVDALIVNTYIASGSDKQTDIYADMISQGFPIVELMGLGIEGVPKVAPDFRDMARIACRRLIGMGHTRIVHVTHDRYDASLRHQGESWDAWMLSLGYKDAMQEAGLREEIIRQQLPPTPMVTPREWIAGGRPIARKILADKTVTAVFTYADFQSYSFMMEAEEKGMKVPRDLSLVCVGSSNVYTFSDPPISTVAIDTRKVGSDAASMVLDLLDGRKTGDRFVSSSQMPGDTIAAPRSRN